MNPVLTKQCPQKRKCSDASPAFGVVIDTATLRCFILNEWRGAPQGDFTSKYLNNKFNNFL